MHAQAFETLPRWGLAAFPQTTIASDLCIRWILPYVGVSLRLTSALFCVSLCHVSRHRLQISHGLPGSMTPIWHRLSKLVATFNWLHGSPSAAHITAARCQFLNQLSYFVAPKTVKCIAYSNRRSVSFSECTYLLFSFVCNAYGIWVFEPGPAKYPDRMNVEMCWHEHFFVCSSITCTKAQKPWEWEPYQLRNGGKLVPSAPWSSQWHLLRHEVWQPKGPGPSAGCLLCF